MRNKCLRIVMLTLLSLCFALPAALANVAILCYHEVDKVNDGFSVTSSQLESHLKFMKDNGYYFVDFDQYLAYTKGELELPEKSVMITFDDGYESFYTKAYPLLKKYQVPAMLAIVSSWTDGEGKPTDVSDLATWGQLQEMEASGLVTVVSHTHAMHKNQQINPQGDLGSVAENHLYLAARQRYETEEEYKTRLDNDFKKVNEVFEKHLGHKARALVWPYGLTSGTAVQTALENGMEATFYLDGGVNPPGENSRLYGRRMIMADDIGTARLKKMLTVDHEEWNSKPIRMAQVDIDSIYDADPQKMNKNIQDVVKHLQNNNITLVALQAFADPDGDGNVDGVYFYNKEVPVTADVFNTVANKLLQNYFTVAAWMPSLTYQSMIQEDGSNQVKAECEAGWYRRLSPFDDEALEKVKNLYRDLSRYTAATGILFQDDLYLNDEEDYSPAAMQAFADKYGIKPYSLQDDEQSQELWADFKVNKLTDFSLELAAAFKENRPTAFIMRDIYSAPVLDKKAKKWFAQDYQNCLENYDYTVIMAYPYMDHEEDPAAYLKQIAEAVKQAGGSKKTIVKVQSYDWDKEAWISSKVFNKQMKLLWQGGIRNLGYYPNTPCLWKN